MSNVESSQAPATDLSTQHEVVTRQNHRSTVEIEVRQSKSKKRPNTELSPLSGVNKKSTQRHIDLTPESSMSDTSFYGFSASATKPPDIQNPHYSIIASSTPNSTFGLNGTLQSKIQEERLQTSILAIDSKLEKIERNLFEAQDNAIHNRLSTIESKLSDLENTLNTKTTEMNLKLIILETKLNADLRDKTNNTEVEIIIRDIEAKLKSYERTTNQELQKLGNILHGLSEFKQPPAPQQLTDLGYNPSQANRQIPAINNQSIQSNMEADAPVNREIFSAPQAQEQIQTNKLPEDLSERERINQKKLNLIVYNFIETGSTTEDAAKVERMIQEYLNVATTIKETSRIGPFQDGRTRPLLLKFNSLFEKRQVLTKAINLRQFENTKGVYIKPDLTFNQIEESKNLVEQLKKRRLDQPETDWTIRRGRIVERQTNNN